MISQSPSAESKLTLYILMCSLVFGVLFSAAQIRIDHQVEKERFNTNLDALLGYQSGQLALALQQYHSTAIQLIFEGLMLNRSIVSVYVEDDLSGYNQRRGLSAEELVSGPIHTYMVEKTVGLFGNNLAEQRLERVGTLTVWIDERAIHAGFRERAAITVAMEVARNVLLALVLVVILRLRLTRPLRELTDLIKDLDPDNALQAPLASKANLRELQELVHKINSLFASVDVEMQRRRQAERRARELNDKLEDKVRARTQELKNSNSQLQQSFDELQRTQRLLLQAQRMASLGHLAAGIAHEINNPIAVVYSNIASLSEYLTELIELADLYQSVEHSISDSAIRQSLEAMRRTVDLGFVRDDAPDLVKASQSSLERVRNIVAELRTFASQEGQTRQRADLAELMHQAIDELDLQHDEHILLDVMMSGIPKVDCVASQIRLAFRHILDNARDAIDGSGRIEVAAEQVDDKVRVYIKDSGVGMNADDLSCSVNPFFTRKEIGKGTGLGLTVVYNVMSNHSGVLDIESEPGMGTLVTFTLPVTALPGATLSVTS